MLGVLKKRLVVAIFFLPLFITLIFNITTRYNDRIVNNSENDLYVYLGGEAIKINMINNGYVVSNDNNIIKSGDIVYKINNVTIRNSNDLERVKSAIATSDIEIIYSHNNEIITSTISESELNNLQGFNNLVGNATITYINAENLKYAAVAHAVLDNVNINNSNFGTIYNSTVESINKSTNNIVGSFVSKQTDKTGTINGMNNTGMYGTYTNDLTNKELVKIGKAHKGTAYIVATLDDNVNHYYEIKITKVTKNDTMNIKYEIIDQTLLNKTNGIIKGMSGSPIVQDGELVGAVSHAINGDYNTAYGLTIDKMINNTK